MDDPWPTVLSLADDRNLGATETAERAAGALARMPRGELADAVETLIRGHPSMAPLWRLGSTVLSERDHATAAERFLDQFGDHGATGAAFAPALPETILTISYSATVAEAVRVRRPQTLLCMASEPGGEGARMAGLCGTWCEARVIDDADALDSLPAMAVVVGADAVTPRSVLNKVKTRELVEAALSRDIPRFAVAGRSKLVPVEIPVSDPFQATPIGLFTQIGTPEGPAEPVLAAARAAAVALHPAMVMLAEMLEKEDQGSGEGPSTEPAAGR